MSDFPDLYSESFEDALAAYRAYGFVYDEFTEFITDVLRRFKPLVVVSHDVNGEYGHGTHLLCAAALMDAVGCAADESEFPESAGLYGTWETEKTYLHLYPENPIALDLDSPLSAFGGKTAFEVTQDGFAKHTSQHWTWFYGWIYGKDGQTVSRATDIKTYSPCYYGLYSSSVGYDTAGGDFMENVIPYAERITESQPPAPVNTDAPAAPSEEVSGQYGPAETDIPDDTGTSRLSDMELIRRIAAAVALAAAAVMICAVAFRLRKRRK